MTKLSAFAFAALIFISSNAFATCRAPLGVYSGAHAGTSYVGTSTTISSKEAFVITLTFNADGSGTMIQTGKINGARFTRTVNFPASENVFDSSICRGTINNGQTVANLPNMLYTVTGNGSNIRAIYYANTDTTTGVYVWDLSIL